MLLRRIQADIIKVNHATTVLSYESKIIKNELNDFYDKCNSCLDNIVIIYCRSTAVHQLAYDKYPLK